MESRVQAWTNSIAKEGDDNLGFSEEDEAKKFLGKWKMESRIRAQTDSTTSWRESNLELRFEYLVRRTDALEKTVADQNLRIEKNMTAIFEAIQHLSNSGNVLSASHDCNQSRFSPAPITTASVQAKETRPDWQQMEPKESTGKSDVGFDLLFDDHNEMLQVSHVEERDELSQKLTVFSDNQNAHQVLDEISVRVHSKQMQREFPKPWTFTLITKFSDGKFLCVEESRKNTIAPHKESQRSGHLLLLGAVTFILQSDVTILHKGTFEFNAISKSRGQSQIISGDLQFQVKHKWRSKLIF